MRSHTGSTTDCLPADARDGSVPAIERSCLERVLLSGTVGPAFCRGMEVALDSAAVSRRVRSASAPGRRDAVTRATLKTPNDDPSLCALRHSAASIMITHSVPLRTVMDVLGQSEIGTTANCGPNEGRREPGWEGHLGGS